ncbi:MAG: fumarylacetoacetate hydrolase family protein [Acidobacteria bacterium]|nr:fumarylacetoacetate hydrolase family protein [Acidobacteriota bacterium]MCI0718284.1 fumarylacetoacetate hydrolase family protein [Acidobacteriota bacterium]
MGEKVFLGPGEVQRVAERMLADYDAHRPNEIFAERGTDWLTLDDAYAVQGAVAELRKARGERCAGYKIGCLSPAIQKQFRLFQPVRGYVWESEARISRCHLAQTSFANLAIEGEIALCLSRDLPKCSGDDLSDCVARWFPVIELHNYVFRGAMPTSQELVAGNGMHAGFVASACSKNHDVAALAHAEIQIEIDGDLVETKNVATLEGGPLGSLRWIVSSLLPDKEVLNAGAIVLTGSPGRLLPVSGNSAVAVMCEGERVEMFVEPASR